MRSTFHYLLNQTLHNGMASLYPDFNHTPATPQLSFLRTSLANEWVFCDSYHISAPKTWENDTRAKEINFSSDCFGFCVHGCSKLVYYGWLLSCCHCLVGFALKSITTYASLPCGVRIEVHYYICTLMLIMWILGLQSIPTNAHKCVSVGLWDSTPVPSALDLSPRPQIQLPFGCSVVGVMWKAQNMS